jgi:predicted MFS family arabinose efflux permease
VAFVVIERFSSHPLLPLRVVTERNRGGSFLTTLLVGLGLFGCFLFLTYYLQGTLHYSALKTGFAYLPFAFGVVAGAAMASQLVLRFRPRTVMALGLVGTILGLLWFSQLGLHSDYWTHLFPAELVMSLGLGLVFVPVNNTALTGVENADAGVASALINSTQQIGGSLGTALLNTVAATVTATYIRTHGSGAHSVAQGTVHGFSVAFLVAAAFLGLALVTVLVLITSSTTPGASTGSMEEVVVTDTADLADGGERSPGLLPA